MMADMHYMLGAIERTRGTNQRDTEKSLDDLFWMDGIYKY